LLDYCFHDFTPLRHIIIAAIDLFRRDVSLHFHCHFPLAFSILMISLPPAFDSHYADITFSH
jgi:hypothetical protein